jgi:hypothetical protein
MLNEVPGVQRPRRFVPASRNVACTVQAYSYGRRVISPHSLTSMVPSTDLTNVSISLRLIARKTAKPLMSARRYAVASRFAPPRRVAPLVTTSSTHATNHFRLGGALDIKQTENHELVVRGNLTLHRRLSAGPRSGSSDCGRALSIPHAGRLPTPRHRSENSPSLGGRPVSRTRRRRVRGKDRAPHSGTARSVSQNSSRVRPCRCRKRLYVIRTRPTPVASITASTVSAAVDSMGGSDSDGRERQHGAGDLLAADPAQDVLGHIAMVADSRAKRTPLKRGLRLPHERESTPRAMPLLVVDIRRRTLCRPL